MPERTSPDENRTVTKRVRLTPSEADLLARLADEADVTESEVLREGIRLVERLERRATHVHELIAMAEGQDEPPKVRFELR